MFISPISTLKGLRGKVNIQVLSALLPERNGAGLSPFIKLRYIDQYGETDVYKKGGQPIWNETFEFLVTEKDGDRYIVDIEVWDTKHKDILGFVGVGFERMAREHRVVDMWFPLRDVRASRLTGKVRFLLDFIWAEEHKPEALGPEETDLRHMLKELKPMSAWGEGVEGVAPVAVPRTTAALLSAGVYLKKASRTAKGLVQLQRTDQDVQVHVPVVEEDSDHHQQQQQQQQRRASTAETESVSPPHALLNAIVRKPPRSPPRPDNSGEVRNTPNATPVTSAKPPRSPPNRTIEGNSQQRSIPGTPAVSSNLNFECDDSTATSHSSMSSSPNPSDSAAELRKSLEDRPNAMGYMAINTALNRRPSTGSIWKAGPASGFGSDSSSSSSSSRPTTSVSDTGIPSSSVKGGFFPFSLPPLRSKTPTPDLQATFSSHSMARPSTSSSRKPSLPLTLSSPLFGLLPQRATAY